MACASTQTMFRHFVAFIAILRFAFTDICDFASHCCFQFPEYMEGVIYKKNVLGLRSSVKATMQSTCLQGFECKQRKASIAFVFDSRLLVRRQKLALVILEQVGSGWLPANGTRISKRIANYHVRLRRAVQLLFFSRYVLRRTIDMYPELKYKSYYLPTRAYSLSNDQYNCDEAQTLRKGKVVVYKYGYLYKCKYDASQRKWMTTGKDALSNATSALQRDCGLHCGKACEQLSLNISVLQFGALGSSNMWRERLCDQLYDLFPGAICLSHAWGEPLRHFVCKAKLILVERFFTHSALETHRIDPLLQAAKTVVSTFSADPELDYEYADMVIFSNRDNVSHTVGRLLSSGSTETLGLQARNAFITSSAIAREMHVCKTLQRVLKQCSTTRSQKLKKRQMKTEKRDMKAETRSQKFRKRQMKIERKEKRTSRQKARSMRQRARTRDGDRAQLPSL